MNSTMKTIILGVVILISAVARWQVVKTANSGQNVQEINFSRFMSEVDQGTVKDVTLIGMEVKGKLADGSQFHTIVPANYPDMIKELQQKNVSVTVQDTGNGSWGWLGWLINLFAPLVLPALLVALGYVLIRALLVHLVRVVFGELRRLQKEKPAGGSGSTAGQNF